MKSNLLAAAFATLFTASTYAHPRVSESLQFKVSIDVAEVTKDPTYGVLFFAGDDIAANGQWYTYETTADCSTFELGEGSDFDVGSVTLYGFANCTLVNNDDPPNEYPLLVETETPTSLSIDPPTVFSGGSCCAPEGEDEDAGRGR